MSLSVLLMFLSPPVFRRLSFKNKTYLKLGDRYGSIYATDEAEEKDAENEGETVTE